MAANILHDFNNCDQCQAMVIEVERLRAELASAHERLISPGWQLPIAGETLHRLRVMTRTGNPSTLVDAYLADLDHLKQWNAATGSETATNALLVPGLTLRCGDALLAGKADDGDMFLYVFPAGQGDEAMSAKQEALKRQAIPVAIRQAYVRGVCHKLYGPVEGEAHFRAGALDIAPYPTLTVRAFHRVGLAELEAIFFHGDAAIFDAKAAGQRGTTIVRLA